MGEKMNAGELSYCQLMERMLRAEQRVAELSAALESLVLFTSPKLSNAVALNNAHRVINRVKGDAA